MNALQLQKITEKQEQARLNLNKTLQGMRNKRKMFVTPTPQPRYDDVYWIGVDWLNNL